MYVPSPNRDPFHIVPNFWLVPVRMNALKGSEGTLLMNNSYQETLLETINFDYSNYEQTTNLLRFTDWLSTKYRRPPSKSICICTPTQREKKTDHLFADNSGNYYKGSRNIIYCLNNILWHVYKSKTGISTNDTV